MFAFITNIRAKEGRREELLALTHTMQQATAREDGVPVYIFHTVEGDPDELWFYDLYASEEAYAAHCATDAFQTMMTSIGELAEIKQVHKLIPYGSIKNQGRS